MKLKDAATISSYLLAVSLSFQSLLGDDNIMAKHDGMVFHAGFPPPLTLTVNEDGEIARKTMLSEIPSEQRRQWLINEGYSEYEITRLLKAEGKETFYCYPGTQILIHLSYAAPKYPERKINRLLEWADADIQQSVIMSLHSDNMDRKYPISYRILRHRFPTPYDDCLFYVFDAMSIPSDRDYRLIVKYKIPNDAPEREIEITFRTKTPDPRFQVDVDNAFLYLARQKDQLDDDYESFFNEIFFSRKVKSPKVLIELYSAHIDRLRISEFNKFLAFHLTLLKEPDCSFLMYDYKSMKYGSPRYALDNEKTLRHLMKQEFEFLTKLHPVLRDRLNDPDSELINMVFDRLREHDKPRDATDEKPE